MGPATTVDGFGVIAPLAPRHPRPQPRAGALAASFSASSAMDPLILFWLFLQLDEAVKIYLIGNRRKLLLDLKFYHMQADGLAIILRTIK